MKKSNKPALFLLVFFCSLIMVFSCKKDEEESLEPTPPQLPPYESMAFDFSDFTNNQDKSGSASDSTQANWGYSAIVVGWWNLAINLTLAVPVTSYYAIIVNDYQPEQLNDGSWQWEYTFKGSFTDSYDARLLGKVGDNTINWKMYISKSGVNSFDEVLWYEGNSNTDGSGGTWELYKDPNNHVKFLQVDWERENGKIVRGTYTNVEQGSNGEGAYLRQGYQTGDYDRFFEIVTDTTSVNIEWSDSTIEGRVESQSWFKDSDWHCWDENGYDVDCAK